MTVLQPLGVAAVVLDIEGTTTPISFVHDILFPFARAEIPRAVSQAAAEPGISEALELVEREREADVAAGESVPDDLIGYLHWLMDRDRKSTGLKLLQGLIWEHGYAEGRLRAPVYADVPAAFVRWRAQDKRIAIYSSGSVHAQRLLFSHSDHGDLTRHLDAYFDTRTGPKKHPESYLAIARALSLAPGQMLFLSDVVGELDAAAASGFHTALVVRDGAHADAGPHPIVERFDQVFQNAGTASAGE